MEFLVVYQKRLLQQQVRLQQAQADYQQQLLAAVIEAQEIERERIGWELHDGIGSTLATAKLLVRRLEGAEATEEVVSLAPVVKDILTNAVHDVRGLSHSLYPMMLARFGLAEALQHLADLCNETSTLTAELTVNYEQPLALSLALYRICQELMHNAQKHAKGSSVVRVLLQQQGPRLTLTVEDDGCGFDPAALTSGGVGLRSIDVRVQLLQAHLHQYSALGQGFCTVVELPAFASL